LGGHIIKALLETHAGIQKGDNEQKNRYRNDFFV
jgi:hypothetical protein